ncbi:endonuclease III [Thalassotalea litorea]|uniref:Endonuclease III n=1 Tax=Thalassotalea litorea TaxID=2020715 RepID=A0A5R9ILX9_9GAMM|nr:endonuclease III [Thalassotalea litorea]
MDVHHWHILYGRNTCTARKPKCDVCIIEDLCKFKDKTD